MGLVTSWGELEAKLAEFRAVMHQAMTATGPKAGRVTKETVLARANGPKKSDDWVTVIPSGAGFVAELHGGFAYLTEKGSYKKPGGWDELPSASTVLASRDSDFIAASAHHPAFAARPFWSEGFAAAVPLVVELYDREGIAIPMSQVFA